MPMTPREMIKHLKKNGFEVKRLGDYPLDLMDKPDDVK